MRERLPDIRRWLPMVGPVEHKEVCMLELKIIQCMCTSKRQQICLLVNSDGGSIGEAIGFYDFVRDVARAPLITVAHGLVASAGIWMLLAANTFKQDGPCRYATRNTIFMLHPIGNRYEQGTVMYKDEIVSEARGIEHFNEKARHVFCSATGLTRQRADKLFRSHRYFDVETALELGIVHKVLGAKEAALAGKKPSQRRNGIRLVR